MSIKEDWKEDFKEAVALHQKAIDGDKEAAKKAHAILKKLKTDVINNPTIEAYFGSASALVAKDHIDLIEKMNLAKRGLKELDKAVKAEPKNYEFRLLRGNVAFRLPEMYFKRTKTAIEDFQFLISEYKSRNKNITKNLFCEILLNLGKCYQTLGEFEKADQAWNQLLKENNRKYKTLVENAKRNGGESS
ncbi:hypothetical protein FS935_02745 [Metabacillus litoralis]|uniref:Uncharacterized protein n=1 Tax=Metabacillus litoralis TaxID=152268 RepID=A0A5C6W9F9_9BACI|nr:hypothetical protein [Metabacillus litoralis]TXC93128.1 hypothetical protein FS935_02745 [Metabacillus litoralis]